MTVMLEVDAATTVAVMVSIDNLNWFQAESWSPSGSASTALNVPVAPYIKINSSAACSLVAQVYGVGGC